MIEPLPFQSIAGGAPVDRRYALTTQLPLAVTKLPLNPRDGDLIRYIATAAATGAFQDAIWNFAYNKAAGYWYNSGSSPLVREIDTAETTVSLTYVNLATVGPQITLPFIGDYMFTYGAVLVNSAAASLSLLSVDFGSGAADPDNVVVLGANNVSASRSRAKTIVTAGFTSAMKYRVTGGTGTFEKRFLNVLPLRIH